MRASIFLLACAALFLVAAPPAHSAKPGSSDSPPSTALAEDPRLQKRVSLYVAGRPLAVVLTEISEDLGADLKADRPTDDQRVTLHVTNQPVHSLMNQLAGLLGHSPATPRGYFWKREKTKAGRAVYRLRRDARSLREEQAAWEYPREKMIQWLRDLSAIARLPAERRGDYHSDLPEAMRTNPRYQPFLTAFSVLTVPNLLAAMGGQRIPLNPSLFPEEAAAYAERGRMQRESAEKHRAAELAGGWPDPFPEGLPKWPAFAPSFAVKWEDEEGDKPWDGGKYGLDLHHALDFRLTLKPQDAGEDRTLFEGTGPMVDLEPYLKSPDVTPLQRSDLAFTLQALAKAAKLTLFEEHFYKGNVFGNPSSGLRILKAPLPTLLQAICMEWECRVQKVGDAYFFWPKNWAFDRAMDIPERKITPWRARLEKLKAFTLEDRAEMAAQFTQAQLRGTLRLALPESGQWFARTTRALRFYGRLSPLERRAASSPGGLATARLDRIKQRWLAQDLLKDVAGITHDDLMASRITWETADPAQYRPGPKVLKVASGRVLYEMFLSPND